jgi:hypothetical protein
VSTEHEGLTDRVDRIVSLERRVMEHPVLHAELEITVAHGESTSVEHRAHEGGAFEGSEQLSQPIAAGCGLLEPLSEREIAHARRRRLHDSGRLTLEEADDGRDRKVILGAVSETGARAWGDPELVRCAGRGLWTWGVAPRQSHRAAADRHDRLDGFDHRGGATVRTDRAEMR